MRLFRLAAVALLVACTPLEADLPDDFPGILTEHGGCADLHAYAADATDRHLLRVHGEGLVAAAYAAGEPTSFTFDLAVDADVVVEVWIGESISQGECSDTGPGDRSVQTEFLAFSGEVVITVTPTGDGTEAWNQTADATIELTDLELERGDGKKASMPAFTFSANVGWLPG